MFPIKDENQTCHLTYVVYIIIALNILSWIFLQGFGLEPLLSKSVCRFGAVPGDLLGLVKAGTQVQIAPGMACVVDGRPDWITVLTSMFMHGGWFHILGNMWFLFIFGDNVEDALGPFRFLIFYLLCGIAAVAAQMAASPASPIPMVGASGAIGGVMGAYAVTFPRSRVHMLVFFGFFFTRIVVPAFLMLGYWFFLQVMGGMLGGEGGGVAFWAHIGGFAAGIILVFLMRNRRRLDECRAGRSVAGRMFERYR